VLSLRLRDGVPNRVPRHRSTGACKYADSYLNGECDWCRAQDAREALEAPAEPNANVIVMSSRFRRDNEDDAPMPRAA
jgi:hypothetical protein